VRACRTWYALLVGWGFAVLLIVVGAVRGMIAKTVDRSGEPLPDIDLLRHLPAHASTLLGVFGMFVVTVVANQPVRHGVSVQIIDRASAPATT
jgi:hypothetical protein